MWGWFSDFFGDTGSVLLTFRIPSSPWHSCTSCSSHSPHTFPSSSVLRVCTFPYSEYSEEKADGCRVLALKWESLVGTNSGSPMWNVIPEGEYAHQKHNSQGLCIPLEYSLLLDVSYLQLYFHQRMRMAIF